MLWYLLIIFINAVEINTQEEFPRKEWTVTYPCKNNYRVRISYENNQPGESIDFYLSLKYIVPENSYLHVKFQTTNPKEIKYSTRKVTTTWQTVVNSKLLKKEKNPTIRIRADKGRQSALILKSVVINNYEYCKDPAQIQIGVESSWNYTSLQNNDQYCGRSKFVSNTNSNDVENVEDKEWPWHALVYRQDDVIINYVCGGTLLSRGAVLTAAHCVSEDGIPLKPKVLGVVLGKQNLLVVNGDPAQYIKVHQVVLHEDYIYRTRDTDLALLKFQREATLNDYIKPACLWSPMDYETLSSLEISGAVAGWGYGHINEVPVELRRTAMEMIPQHKCVYTDYSYYGPFLNDHNFCLGTSNEKANCIFDSGSGFIVFVPDNEANNTSGSWHIRGLASHTPTLADGETCNPQKHMIFTDIAPYYNWIRENMQ